MHAGCPGAFGTRSYCKHTMPSLEIAPSQLGKSRSSCLGLWPLRAAAIARRRQQQNREVQSFNLEVDGNSITCNCKRNYLAHIKVFEEYSPKGSNSKFIQLPETFRYWVLRGIYWSRVVITRP